MTCGSWGSADKEGAGTDSVRESCWAWAASWPGPVSLPAAYSYFLISFSFIFLEFYFISNLLQKKNASNQFKPLSEIF
jgi:hypothetical protein